MGVHEFQFRIDVGVLGADGAPLRCGGIGILSRQDNQPVLIGCGREAADVRDGGAGAKDCGELARSKREKRRGTGDVGGGVDVGVDVDDGHGGDEL